jgi:stage III sporulation protein AB
MIGAVLIAGSAASCGIRAAWMVRREASVLEELQTVLERMSAELHFRRLPVPELLRACAASCKTPLGALLEQAAAQMELDSTCTAGAAFASVSMPNSVPSACTEILRSLGDTLGRSDLDGQLRAIELAQSRAARLVKESDSRRAGRCRCDIALGMSAALAILILLS